MCAVLYVGQWREMLVANSRVRQSEKWGAGGTCMVYCFLSTNVCDRTDLCSRYVHDSRLMSCVRCCMLASNMGW
jgi:hypothetical protein